MRACFGLLAVAWLVWLLGLAHGAWIESQFVGPADDVTDSLRRGGYVAERLLPFDAAAVGAEIAAGYLLLAAWAANRLGWRGVLACVLWLPSATLHDLAFLMHLFFAG